MSWKRRVRGALDGVAQAAGVLRALEATRGAGPLVLMHHRVLPRERCAAYPFASLALPTELFEAQVAWLAERFELRTLSAAFDGSAPADRPVVALTFDDGYDDNYRLAAPILERHGARATFFVAADFVAGRAALWYDRAAVALAALGDTQLASAAQQLCGSSPRSSGDAVAACVEALKRLDGSEREEAIAGWESRSGARVGEGFAAMTPEQVRELSARGHEIGGHSLSHALLPQCDDEQLARELDGARAELAMWCGRSIESLAYPDGAHDDRVVAAARRAGYRWACTTAPPARGASAEALRIGRIDITSARISSRDGAFDPLALRAELAGFHEVLR